MSFPPSAKSKFKKITAAEVPSFSIPFRSSPFLARSPRFAHKEKKKMSFPNDCGGAHDETAFS
jgi:hypothetical protein